MSTLKNRIEYNKLEFLLAVFGYFVILAFLLVYYFQERNMSNYVHHTNCYAPISDYSVEPGKSSDSILDKCGPDKNEPCCYNASNLKDAINYVQINKGSKFSYNETTKNTCIIDPISTNYRDNNSSSIYTKTRYSINQSSNGALKKENTVGEDTSTNNSVIFKNYTPRSFTTSLA